MTDHAQKQYNNLVCSINKLAYLLNKHDSIRLKHWLDKLAIPVTNSIWKQNRNLYLKILLEMVNEGQLMKPFNQSPPQGPLPKITIYDVPYPIRIKLMSQQHSRDEKNTPSQHKTSFNSRKNSLNNNIDHKRSLSKNSVNAQTKKITFDSIKSEKQNRDHGNSLHFRDKNSIKNGNKAVNKDLFNSSKNSTCKFKINQLAEISTNTCDDNRIRDRGCAILKKSLKFLGKYCDQFQDSISYKQLLERIVQTGDLMGENFREVSIPSMDDSIKIEKYNERIKDKLFQTDVNTMEFMNYLNSLV